jgi:hypothetical protein
VVTVPKKMGAGIFVMKSWLCSGRGDVKGRWFSSVGCVVSMLSLWVRAGVALRVVDATVVMICESRIRTTGLWVPQLSVRHFPFHLTLPIHHTTSTLLFFLKWNGYMQYE